MISPRNTTVRIIARRERDAKTAKQLATIFASLCAAVFLFAAFFALSAAPARAAEMYSCDDTVAWVSNTLYQNIDGRSLTGDAYAFATWMKCNAGTDCITGPETGDGMMQVLDVGLSKLAQVCTYSGQTVPAGTTAKVYGFVEAGAGSCTGISEGDTVDLSGAYYFKIGDKPPITQGTWYAFRSYSASDVCANEVEKNNPPWDAYWFAYDSSPIAPPDPREDPVVTILEPDEDETVAQSTINATGAEAFYFIVKSDVSSVTYPSETPEWEVEIYDDAEPPVALSCRMISEYSGTVDGTDDYGTQTHHKVNGDPDPCANFAQGDYSIRARVTFPENEAGDWTAWWDFTVGDIDLDPPITCPEGASFITDFPCWSTNAIAFLLTPSEASIQALFDTVDDFGGRWPFSWFTDSFGAFVDAIDVDATDFGEADGGNPLSGDYPNSAWWVEKIQMWFGAWAAPAFAAFIWIGACLAILRAGMRLLNIEYEEVEIDE